MCFHDLLNIYVVLAGHTLGDYDLTNVTCLAIMTSRIMLFYQNLLCYINFEHVTIFNIISF